MVASKYETGADYDQLIDSVLPNSVIFASQHLSLVRMKWLVVLLSCLVVFSCGKYSSLSFSHSSLYCFMGCITLSKRCARSSEQYSGIFFSVRGDFCYLRGEERKTKIQTGDKETKYRTVGEYSSLIEENLIYC